jgi:hypothetical protein
MIEHITKEELENLESRLAKMKSNLQYEIANLDNEISRVQLQLYTDEVMWAIEDIKAEREKAIAQVVELTLILNELNEELCNKI